MKLERKELDKLFKKKYHFFIPDYQRGYKWTKMEVLKLLNDIWEFYLNNNSKDDTNFYCLQPVVVKPMEGKYYVIDGQQRLTTLLIIQQAINDYKCKKLLPNMEYDSMPALSAEQYYSIEYETRANSDKWLKTRNNKEEMQKNSDYYHIFGAYHAALDFLKWIDSSTPDDYTLDGLPCPKSYKKINADTEFETCIREKCNVIWYELDTENENDHEIFDRLNTGKIPLTNAELIKAMFLQEGNYPTLSGDEKIKSEDYRTNIARQWDDIERKLQDPFFWDFIYDEKHVGMTYDTRIEYLFDLLANKEKENSDRFYFTFDYYDSLFRSYKDKGDAIDFVNEEWKRLRNLIQTLQDWYDNKTYYHYIGYLISQGRSVNELKNIQFPTDEEGNPLPVPKKAEFVAKLVEQIRKQTYEYKHHTDLMKSKEGLTPVLLLFNVLNVLDNSEDSDRFPFHYYKHTTWNEEHVAPATPFEPNRPDRCFQFAAQMLEYYTDISFYEKLESLTIENNKKPRNERKKKEALVKEVIRIVTPQYNEYIKNVNNADICKELLEIFKKKGENQEELADNVFNKIVESLGIDANTLNEDDDRRDYIWNQVLLDEGTNKSYGNAIFPYKRMRIIKNTTKGIFVPIGTYNVFVKAYSHRMTNMLEWDDKDAMRYLAEIFKTLNRNGRNFLKADLINSKDENTPDYIDIDELKKMINNEQ